VRRVAASVATVLLFGMCGFQLALALGFPLAQFAWGGQYTGALPVPMRWASGASIAILGLMAWVVLARADMARPGSGSRAIRIAAWVFAAYLALNTLGNLTSKSGLERVVMTPISTILAACVIIVASSPRTERVSASD
jgi:hypothetical protein